MREIKFRGRDKLDDGAFSEWLYGSLDLTEYRPIIRPNGGVPETVMPETVGEWTGLKDKNGTEIYEGDVVALFLGRMSYPGVVKFVEKSSAFCARVGKKWFPLNIYDEFEILGNIFDNPELKERFWTVWNQESNEISNE